MRVSDGESLTLRPDGFAVEAAAIADLLERLPGTFRSSAEGPFTLVVPAAAAPDVRANLARREPVNAEYVVVWVAPDEVKIHPGSSPGTWGRAQRVVQGLLGLGSWRVWGEGRELGVVRSIGELFPVLRSDPDVPEDPTESPPRAGELLTLRRYLGDVSAGDYYHELFRFHDSGAFSYEERTGLDQRRWRGKVSPGLTERVATLARSLDFRRRSPGDERDFEDKVTVSFERPGFAREIPLDAKRPPETFAELVDLLDGWADALRGGRTPDGLVLTA